MQETEQIHQAIKQARAAQAPWGTTTYTERGRIVEKIKTYLLDHADDLAEQVSRLTGKPRVEALASEVIPCTLACAWYQKNTAKILAPQRLPTSSILFFSKQTSLHRQPLGVVAIFSPWNYPLAIPFAEVIMGLMAGNAIILKVADETPAIGETIARIVEHAGLPSGLFHHVTGDGAALSEALFAEGIDKFFFTGSVRVGKLLMKKASETLTPLCLELGGKDPMLVLADADLERASNGALWGGLHNAGQTCAGIERIYVEEKIYDRFVELLARKIKRLRQGPDGNFDVEIGAVTTQRQYDTIARQVDAALADGATIIAQAELTDPRAGLYYPATLLGNVDHRMTIMREETFGPILGIMKFATIDEAVTLANQSSYALTASIWTRDHAHGIEIAKRIDAGVCTVNDHLFTHALSEIPWGGFKHSGFGRTHGRLGLEEMTQVKAISWDWLSPKRNVYWYPYSERTYLALRAALNFSFLRQPLRSAATFVPYYLGKVFSRWRETRQSRVSDRHDVS